MQQSPMIINRAAARRRTGVGLSEREFDAAQIDSDGTV
jgi:hypothetical protein